MKFQFLSQVGGHADDDVLALLVASHPVSWYFVIVVQCSRIPEVEEIWDWIFL